MRFFAVTCSLLLMSSVALAAPATDRAQATRHFEIGRAQVKKGRCDLAVPEFRASIDAEPNVGAWLNLGECLETQGKLQEAYEAYRTGQSLAAERRDDRVSVGRTNAERIEAKTVRVSILSGLVPGTHVQIDGIPVETASVILVSPNVTHRVALDTSGKLITREVRGRPGEVISVTFDEGEATPPPPSTTPSSGPTGDTPKPHTDAQVMVDPGKAQRAVGFVVGGVGIAALVAGGIVGALALSSRSQLANAVANDPACKGEYPNVTCSSESQGRILPLQDRAQTEGGIAIGLLAGGAVTLVAGIVIALVAPKAKPALSW
jgi:hypothetical protein